MEKTFIHNLTHEQLIQIFNEYKEWSKVGTLKENSLIRKVTDRVYGENITKTLRANEHLNQIAVDISGQLAELYVQSLKSRFNVQELYEDYQGE